MLVIAGGGGAANAPDGGMVIVVAPSTVMVTTPADAVVMGTPLVVPVMGANTDEAASLAAVIGVVEAKTRSRESRRDGSAVFTACFTAASTRHWSSPDEGGS